MENAAETAAPKVVAYLTDVEGLWSKLVDFTTDNPHVSLDEQGEICVAEGAVFVFGGDAIDRGPRGRRLVSALLSARQRQPGQVVLLAGNRDINKLRLPRELSGHPPRRTPDEVRRRPRPELLRWIFDNTMGARAAFECRKAELVQSGQDARDDAVVESFLSDLTPDGDLTRYLAACQLAYRAGATFFVHGSVTAENLGCVPGDPGRLDDVDEWASSLNRWYQGQVEAYAQGALASSGEPAWAPLIAYQAPLPGAKVNQQSVVYGRPTDDDGNPSLPPRPVVEALQRCGVRRVVLGHSPAGDSPALLRGGGFELLVADTSYSPVEAGARVFLRDDLVESDAPVRIAGERARIAVRRGDDALVGLRTGDGFLVQGELSSGDFLLQKRASGFEILQRVASRGQLAGMGLREAW